MTKLDTIRNVCKDNDLVLLKNPVNEQYRVKGANKAVEDYLTNLLGTLLDLTYIEKADYLYKLKAELIVGLALVKQDHGICHSDLED